MIAMKKKIAMNGISDHLETRQYFYSFYNTYDK